MAAAAATRPLELVEALVHRVYVGFGALDLGIELVQKVRIIRVNP